MMFRGVRAANDWLATAILELRGVLKAICRFALLSIPNEQLRLNMGRVPQPKIISINWRTQTWTPESGSAMGLSSRAPSNFGNPETLTILIAIVTVRGSNGNSIFKNCSIIPKP